MLSELDFMDSAALKTTHFSFCNPPSVKKQKRSKQQTKHEPKK